jgi:hypothetical protein
VRTTNWQRCESLERLLARCEEYRDRLEAMPDGKPLLEQLRESVRTARGFVKPRPAGPRAARQASRKAAADRRNSAVMVRLLTNDLLREARLLCATGVAIELPPLWNGNRRRLIADARSALEAVAPLAAVFRARGVTDYDELPRWIAWLEEAMEAHAASRGRGGAAMSDALRKGAEAAVGLQPLFLAAVHGDYYRAAEWSRVRWTGPARARTRKTRVAVLSSA